MVLLVGAFTGFVVGRGYRGGVSVRVPLMVLLVVLVFPAAATGRVRDDPLLQRTDPLTGLPYEWQFSSSRVDLALNVTAGSPSVLVGIVDSGVSDIPDLVGKVAVRLWGPAESDGLDLDGHGTAVASLLAATPDDGVGMAGYGGAARVVSYRVRDLNYTQVAAGVTELVNRGVRVINLSFGSASIPAVLRDAITDAMSRGVLVVAAVGNSGGAVSQPAGMLQPAGGGDSGGLAVGASNRDGSRAAFSNVGNVSLLAPGSLTDRDCRGVLVAFSSPSKFFDSTPDCPFGFRYGDGSYTYPWGTSFSAPEVAGAAALVWAVRPDLSNVQVASILKQSARRPAGAGWNTSSGWGVLDVAAAVELATGKSTADKITVTPSTVRGNAGAHVTITGNATWADGVTVKTGMVACGESPAVFTGAWSCAVPTSAVDGGRTVNVNVTVTSEGVTGTGLAAVELADVTAPTVRVYPSRGSRGGPIALQFYATDETGGTLSAVLLVKHGAATVRTFRRTVESGKPGRVLWTAPRRKGRYSVCVSARDGAGNTSAVCNTIRVT